MIDKQKVDKQMVMKVEELIAEYGRDISLYYLAEQLGLPSTAKAKYYLDKAVIKFDISK